MVDETLAEIVAESLISLELPGVLEEVAAHALSAPGREEVLAAVPEDDVQAIRHSLDLVAELKEIIGIQGTLGLGTLIPMEGILSRLDNAAAILESEEILAVADLAVTAGLVRNRLHGLDDRFRLLKIKGGEIIALDLLKTQITRVLDEHGMVRSTASPRLMEIHERARTNRERIKKRLEAVVRDQDLARIVQEDYVTMRNDRYVILLRPEFKGLLDGIVHDHSRSGASVYVEPFRVVELNNEVAALMDEERDEIRRIFSELTENIRGVRDAVEEDYRLLTFLDAFQARALYASATSAIPPELVENGFRLVGARHPLLLAADPSSVVPMDVIQTDFTTATVISGANMGGKTVALKIAGLFPLMVRCGIMVPAQEGTQVQPFARIAADIGEDQDIRTQVSSFSSHMLKIKAILDSAGPEDLVLLDELGGATDPEEGSALAMAILDELIARRCRVVVTTHLTLLKAYALGKQNVKNVSVEFHPVTLKPTFRLLYDLPGESHAIETAERIGLSQKVVSSARAYLDRAGGGSSSLVESLRRKLSEVELQSGELQEKERRLEDQWLEIRSKREEIIEDFRKEALQTIRKAERDIADLQQSLKSGRLKGGHKPREVIAQIKQEITQQLGTPLEKRPLMPEIGATVRIKSLNREGTVRALSDKDRVEVAVGGLTVRADAEDLLIVDRGPVKNNSSKKKQIGVHIPPASPRWETNVIGLRVDEAIPIVEKALDEALLGGLSSITIIHGKGTGRLKKGLWEYLSGHPLVGDLRGGDARSGGEGVTIVELVTE
ncbi:MAG: Smr/MutS family protein [Desulfomonile tiedjei]|nr:Smr/MutS family protein [Desulfomonile tiedjei]